MTHLESVSAVFTVDTPAAGPGDTDSGMWHDGWSEEIQSRWLRSFYEIALSKPFVDTVTWRSLIDDPAQIVPSGGLVKSDLTRKPAYGELLALRREFAPDAGPR